MTDPSVVAPQTHACTGCGKFAFAEPTLCFWCRKGIPSTHLTVAAPKMRTIEDVRRAANALKHRCAGYLCIASIDGDRLMCEGHMAMLPPWLCIKLEKAHSPTAAEPWPRDLVAEAIRFTMSDGQMVALTDVPNQREIFAVTSVGGTRK